MPKLTPRQEAFCQAYAATPNGAAAARDAGYAEDHAAKQAVRLLRRPEIAERVGALGAIAVDRHGAPNEERVAAAREIAAQLAPVYRAALTDKDYDGVLQVVELQARVSGLVSGGSSIKPRGPRPAPAADDDIERADLENKWEHAMARVGTLSGELRGLRRGVARLQHVVERMAGLVDPVNEHEICRSLYSKSGAPLPLDREPSHVDFDADDYDDDDDHDDDDEGLELPMNAHESQ